MLGINDMSEVTPYDVFFSYTTEDHDAVNAVAHACREQGVNVFLDR